MSFGTVCSGLRTNLDLSGIDYLGLERVLKRGTGQVIEQHDQAVFVHDSVSGAFLLGCENVDLGADILKHGVGSNCRLLMVSDHGLNGISSNRQSVPSIFSASSRSARLIPRKKATSAPSTIPG